MNNPRLTIVLLILIVLAAMYTSGRLTALSNAIMGRAAGSVASAPVAVAALNNAGGAVHNNGSAGGQSHGR